MWFMLLMLVCFIAWGSIYLLGDSNNGGKKMADEKKYSVEECHKKFAIELNNLVWNLLGKKDRTKEEDEKMIHAAHHHVTTGARLENQLIYREVSG